ncbi:hypothetical protein [Streptomyces liangshanensis]|uniref:hypothetical protein n=1 Tax=Streptomyces liangshanensis TaxID=2717324 RepID=UPI001AAF5F84|nr:hypothetical protein [Streptomyces liangshanensis]
MTRTPLRTSTTARSPRRSRYAVPGATLAITALAALALTACGTTKAGAAHARDTSGAVGARPATGMPRPDAEMAFLEMLTTVGETCVGATPGGDEVIPPGERPRSRPERIPPIGAAPSGPPATLAPDRGTELHEDEWCARRLHEERVGRALRSLARPTPARVREVLNRLGYIDARIHGVGRSGATIRFFVDLRFMGSRLALRGTAAGPRSVVEGFGVFESGPFDPGAVR